MKIKFKKRTWALKFESGGIDGTESNRVAILIEPKEFDVIKIYEEKDVCTILVWTDGCCDGNRLWIQTYRSLFDIVDNKETEELPKIKDWYVSNTGEKYFNASNKEYVKEVLEKIYAINSYYSRGPIKKNKNNRDTINKLALDLVGGIPEFFEEYT